MLIGYGVGLSWAGCVVELSPQAVLMHADYTGTLARQ
jgi:hypothetical protein